MSRAHRIPVPEAGRHPRGRSAARPRRRGNRHERWRPSPGSVYPTLQQLEDEGLLEPAESESGRRVFRLTGTGRDEAAQLTGAAPWDEVGEQADDALVELRDLVSQVLAATRQVAQAGSARQVAAAQDVLRATRKSLYRLLPEDDVPEGGDT